MTQNICPKCATVCSGSARFCIRCRSPLSRKETGKTCAQGHRMDPSWSECPFCESAQAPTSNPLKEEPRARGNVSRQQTMVEATTQAAPLQLSADQEQADPFKTLLAPSTEVKPAAKPGAKPPAPESSRMKTQVVARPRSGTSKSSKIVAALVSYSHNSSGSAFLLRIGRNVLGNNDAAQVRVNDPCMSDKHAIIVASEKETLIDDCLSTNGTYVNGEALHQKLALKHGDVIQTGNTLWRFAQIEEPDPALKRNESASEA